MMKPEGFCKECVEMAFAGCATECSECKTEESATCYARCNTCAIKKNMCQYCSKPIRDTSELSSKDFPCS